MALCVLLTDCNGQTRRPADTASPGDRIGGDFENREFMYYGIPDAIDATDTSAGWPQPGQKILLKGTVYAADGKTPVPGVLLYYYQTNTEGRYLHRPEEPRSMPPNERRQTNGYIRGWVRTDSTGRYFIYTVRPGSYPGSREPAHVHVSVKEPNVLNEYYIDEFLFDDDPFLTADRRKKLENRGGNGVLRLIANGDLQVGERNIVLGRNIPNYPARRRD